MVAQDRSAKVWAYLLIGLGFLFLLMNYGWFGWLTGWLWSALLLLVGAGFLYFYSSNRQHWWALIPGFSLLGLGLASVAGSMAGPLLLALIGVGFFAVYLSQRQHWWSLIPAGVLMTLATVAWLDVAFPRVDTGGVFFVGIGLTFLVLTLLPEGEGKQRWAIYPALAALALAALTVFSSLMSGTMLAVALILLGAYLLWRERGPLSQEQGQRQT